jgi:hypothetical protein
MSVNLFNTFLHVMAFVIHGIKYWPTEIFHAQDLVSFYCVLIIMPNIQVNFITVRIFVILRKELNAIFFCEKIESDLYDSCYFCDQCNFSRQSSLPIWQLISVLHVHSIWVQFAWYP